MLLYCSHEQGNPSSARNSPSCCAGASFFYEKGPVPYEAHEVRAFGLFLADMVRLIPRRRRASLLNNCPISSSLLWFQLAKP
jgi:hypothetical protein